MEVIVILIAAGILVAGGFLAAYIWAVRTGQFDDKYTPSIRILFDDKPLNHLKNQNTKHKD